MPLEIRPYCSSDAAAIIELSVRTWAPVFEKMQPAVPGYVYDAFYPQGWQARQVADITAFLTSDSDAILVAIDGEALVGWVGYRLHPSDNMGEIYILATDPAHQKRGVATALMDQAFDAMKAAGMAIVMVETGDDPGHAPSRAAYERVGFERWLVARYFRKL